MRGKRGRREQKSRTSTGRWLKWLREKGVGAPRVNPAIAGSSDSGTSFDAINAELNRQEKDQRQRRILVHREGDLSIYRVER